MKNSSQKLFVPQRVATYMTPTAHYRPPRQWIRTGKYLLPVGVANAGWAWTRPPREQARLADLVADHPDSVTLHSLGAGEMLPEFEFQCHAGAASERRSLPAEWAPAAYVAELQGGLSFGRHCCVIGPAGKAVRETALSVDGEVHIAKKPLSRLRPRYWRKRFEGDVTVRPWLPPKQRFDGVVAALNARSCHNFFHWLIEILPRLATLRRAGLAADYYLVESVTPFQRRVLEALGVRQSQLIQPHCRLLVEARRLLAPSFPSPACLRQFRDTLLAALSADGPVVRPRRIFISRRRAGTRTLANEPQLEELLRAHGFESCCMEEYSLAQQARLVHEAEVVVGAHGAGLANLLFARPGTSVVEIVPAGRFNAMCYPRKSRIFGLHHQLIFAESVGRRRGLHVDLDDVRNALIQTNRIVPGRAAA